MLPIMLLPRGSMSASYSAGLESYRHRLRGAHFLPFKPYDTGCRKHGTLSRNSSSSPEGPAVHSLRSSRAESPWGLLGAAGPQQQQVGQRTPAAVEHAKQAAPDQLRTFGGRAQRGDHLYELAINMDASAYYGLVHTHAYCQSPALPTGSSSQDI